MSGQDFTGLRYLEAGDKSRLLRAVAGCVDAVGARRVLEIGCGAGAALLSLARLLEDSGRGGVELLGVDISAANLAVAQARADEAAHGQRLRFRLCDYLAEPFGPVEVIFADSVLHLLGSPARPLLAKLAADLAPGGRLLCTLPDDRLYNRLLWTMRRVFRALRCKALDALFLALAKALHSGQYSEAQLRDRIPYMYILPAFRLDAALRTQVAEAGLVVVSEELMPHVSLGQPGHRLLVLGRPG